MSVDISIRRLEKQKGFHSLVSGDELLLGALHRAVTKNRQEIIALLKSKAAERQYLLSLIKKYADGQAIALRLNKQVSNINKSIVSYIKEYNSIAHSVPNSTGPAQLCFQQVTDCTSDMWQINSEAGNSQSAVLLHVRHQIVHHTQMVARAEEEIVYVEEDMENYLLFHIDKHDILLQKMEDYKHLNLVYARGALSLINDEIFGLECKIRFLINIFSDILNVQSLNTFSVICLRVFIMQIVNMLLVMRSLNLKKMKFCEDEGNVLVVCSTETDNL